MTVPSTTQHTTVQMSGIMKANRVCYDDQSDYSASTYASHQDEADRTDATTGEVMNLMYSWDVAGSVILQKLGGVVFTIVVAHRNNAGEIGCRYVSGTARTQLSAK